MRFLAVAAFSLSVVFQAGTIYAGIAVQVDMACPVGGEKFKHTSTASYTVFGSRPDGKPYGSWVFPMALPVCPSNKLPVYKKFSAAEIGQLTPLVESGAFQALGERETPYYRAAWLMEKLGEDPANIGWMIVQASWESDADPVRKRRYQQEYVARLRALPQGKSRGEWLWMQARAANGLRELGQFKESANHIDSILPQAEHAAAEAEKATSGDRDRTLRSARYLVEFLKRLKPAAVRENASSQPISMLSADEAKRVCLKPTPEFSQQDIDSCRAPGIEAKHS